MKTQNGSHALLSLCFCSRGFPELSDDEEDDQGQKEGHSEEKTLDT
jgi:hypothetical protein